MPVLYSRVDTVVVPSHGVFCLRSDNAELQDLATAGRLAFADGIGFASTVVGVRGATEVSNALVSVEMWSRMPVLLRDQGPFDFAWEGVIEFSNGRWCIDESLDSSMRLGLELPSGTGRYGVRVAAYNHNEALDRYEAAQAGSDEGFASALVELKQLDTETAERYRIQLWPVERRG
ncbi:hypothetical protein [Salinispora tropica]|uniref:hypothetical protein n=1 Tax=Salinispora tropica TaxID=168695 RepID=UPI0012D34608|nr:hypothetical protein [Salinispora tropica]